MKARYAILASCIIILFTACSLQGEPALSIGNVSADQYTWKIELKGRLLEIKLLAVCASKANESRAITARHGVEVIAEGPVTDDGCAYLKPENVAIYKRKPYIMAIDTKGMEGEITLSVLARDPDTNEEIAGEPKTLRRPSPLVERVVQ